MNDILNENVIKELFSLADRYIKMKERESLFHRFAEVLVSFEEAKETAFNYIFQQEIYSHILSDFRLNKDELIELQQLFVHKVTDICGPNIMKDLEEMRGGLEPVVLDLSYYFVNRVNKEETQVLNSDEENEIPKDKSKINNVSFQGEHNRYK